MTSTEPSVPSAGRNVAMRAGSVVARVERVLRRHWERCGWPGEAVSGVRAVEGGSWAGHERRRGTD